MRLKESVGLHMQAELGVAALSLQHEGLGWLGTVVYMSAGTWIRWTVLSKQGAGLQVQGKLNITAWVRRQTLPCKASCCPAGAGQPGMGQPQFGAPQQQYPDFGAPQQQYQQPGFGGPQQQPGFGGAQQQQQGGNLGPALQSKLQAIVQTNKLQVS